MLKTNYHTHSRYCDGTGSPAEYAEAAVRRGLKALGFSSHAPVSAPVSYDSAWTMNPEDLPAYLADIRKLKTNPPGDLQVYAGLEIDYIHGLTGPDAYKDRGLDFTIGAVHMVRNSGDGRHLSVDGPDEEFETLLRRTFGGDMRAFVKEYYTLLSELIENHSFSFLAHFDLIKKKNRDNRYFDENASWYRKCALEPLTLAAEKGIPLEINSGGISRGAIDSVYPSPWLLKEAHDRSVPILINSDAHRPAHVDFYFEESRGICRDKGYREVRVLIDGGWRDEEI